MAPLPRSLLTVLGLGTLACGPWFLAAPAYAQNSNAKFQSGVSHKPATSALPEVKPQPQAWPRLDPGAVLCRTEDDLSRLAARRHGESVAGQVDCHIIRDPTAITIVQRSGPGRTEVKVTAAKEGDIGWTDAWLPQRAPAPGATSASR